MSVGLICEFNPFHYGHRYLIAKAHELTGEQVVCVMSGPFTQRGDPACADKYARTAAALNDGADAVIELPVKFATAAAENFAKGGIKVLQNIRGISTLVFGVETDKPELLFEIVKIKQQPRFEIKLKELLSKGKSYPTAAAEAIGDGDKEIEKVLSLPNNLLAVEYIGALSGTGITPLPIKRVGNDYHDKSACGAFVSASAVRENLLNPDIKKYLPPEMLSACLCSQPDRDLFHNLIIYALRKMSLSQLSELPFVESGFEYALERAVKNESYKGVIDSLKSARYTYARIKRILLYALLGIDKHIMSDINSVKTRVLGIKKEFTQFFSTLNSNIIVRNSDADEAYKNDASVKIDAFADDVYSLLQGKAANVYYGSPIVIL